MRGERRRDIVPPQLPSAIMRANSICTKCSLGSDRAITGHPRKSKVSATLTVDFPVTLTSASSVRLGAPFPFTAVFRGPS